MSLAKSSSTRRLQIEPAVIEENRLHRRFELPLAGRFMRADKTEQPCRLKDISVGGVAVTVDSSTAASIKAGERIVAYIDQLGGLEGDVVRVWPNGFAFKLTATLHKREKLAAQITWLLNEADLKGAAARQHERIVVGHRSAELRISGGISLPCLLLDVSLSGASIACKAKPDAGTEVFLGRFRARVVRHHAAGIGLQFMELLELETLQAYFG